MLENSSLSLLTKAPKSTLRLLLLSILTSCVLLLLIWRPQGVSYAQYREYLKLVTSPSSTSPSVGKEIAHTSPVPQPEAKESFKPVIRPDVEPDAEPDVESDRTPESESELIPNIDTDVEPDVEPDSTPEAKLELMPEVKPDTTPPPESGYTPELKTEPELEPIKHCREFRTRGDILLVVKTGATEAYKRLPVHFNTTLQCPQDYLIFSDVEQELDGVRIHDALDHMKDMVDKNTGEWHFKEALEDVRANKSPDEYRKMDHGEGWRLDKFKNLPMMLKSYKMFPNKKWYFFIDADTAVIWSNLLTWLSKFDSNRPYYMGSQTMIGDVEFGHGGSGYAVSQAAARTLFEEGQEQKRRHHQYAMHVCCGDMLLSHAFIDNDIHLYRSWPILQGEPPPTLDFGPWHWDKPAVTFHHMSPAQVQDVYDFEQRRRLLRQRAPTYEDVFEHFVAPELARFGGAKDDWDNNWEAGQTITRKAGSSERDRLATRDFRGCGDACARKSDCLQFTYWPGHCSLATVMRLGRKRDGRKAGWNMARIERWKEEHANRSTDWMLDWNAHE